MPAMSDLSPLRKQAWAGLVGEMTARRPTAATLLRDQPRLVSRTREARASAGAAREVLASVRRAVEANPRDPVQLQLVRAWASCVDDILALTERLCGTVAA